MLPNCFPIFHILGTGWGWSLSLPGSITLAPMSCWPATSSAGIPHACVATFYSSCIGIWGYVNPLVTHLSMIARSGNSIWEMTKNWALPLEDTVGFFAGVLRLPYIRDCGLKPSLIEARLLVLLRLLSVIGVSYLLAKTCCLSMG
jgi:hypothetical protein